MSEYDYALFDAFSEQAFGGSIAGIVMHAQNLDAAQMQCIAREIAAPATGFVTAYDKHSVDVRFFSTRTEYPMCGHGTIGLMTWLVEQRIFEPPVEQSLPVILRTPASQAQVDISRREDGKTEVMLTLDPASFEACSGQKKELARLLGIQPGEIQDIPAMELTHSDFAHLIVPIRDLDIMRKIEPDFGAIEKFCHEINIDTIAVFTTETVSPSNTIHCREFAPAVGTPEAPASGTTNRALACYLLRHGLIDVSRDGVQTILAEQGYEMGRPSLLRSELTLQNGDPIKIRVGGVAIKTMQGKIFIADS